MKKSSNRIFRFGNRYLVAFLAFLGAFAPISTDMYLPALPSMAINLHTSNDMVAASISLFMLSFAISMLFWGALSDKYGRRPVLFAGLALYVISSAAIALAESIWPLLFWRCVQAIGSGAVCSLSLAIVKDIMRGERMEKMVGIMQAATVLAPLTAPLIGGVMLLWTSWRGIFWCLALCGLLALLGVFALAETSPKKREISLLATFGRMGFVLRNRHFRNPLLLFSAMSMPFFSYLATSAFIYQDGFGLDAQVYSLFFALNASCSLLGPLSFIYWLRHYPRNRVITAQLAAISLFGFALLFFGSLGPWWFALLFAPITYCGSALRPPSTVLMMTANEGDNGIVASLISCGGLLGGSLSMFVATLGIWANPVFAVGTIAVVVAGIGLLFWLKIKGEYSKQ